MKNTTLWISILITSFILQSQSYATAKALVKPENSIAGVYFSNQPIDHLNLNNLTSANLKETFNIGESIYCAVRLDMEISKYKAVSSVGNKYLNSVWDAESQSYKSQFGVSVEVVDENGKIQYAFYNLSTSGTIEKSSTSFSAALFENEKNDDRNKKIKEIYNTLKIGTYTAKVSAYGFVNTNAARTKVLASGEFKLVKTDDQKLKLGVSFGDLVPQMENPELESKLLKAIQKYAVSQNWSEQFNAIKIAESQFTTLRNEYTGIVVGRTIAGWAYATWPDGHCSYQKFTFVEDYDGANYTGNYQYYSSGTTITVDCLN